MRVKSFRNKLMKVQRPACPVLSCFSLYKLKTGESIFSSLALEHTVTVFQSEIEAIKVCTEMTTERRTL